MLRQFDYDLRNEQDLETTKDVAAEFEVQATSGHMLQLCLPFQVQIMSQLYNWLLLNKRLFVKKSHIGSDVR
jgi:hypothetical protein